MIEQLKDKYLDKPKTLYDAYDWYYNYYSTLLEEMYKHIDEESKFIEQQESLINAEDFEDKPEIIQEEIKKDCIRAKRRRTKLKRYTNVCKTYLVSRKVYNTVVEVFVHELKKTLIMGKDFKAPFGMGTLGIRRGYLTTKKNRWGFETKYFNWFKTKKRKQELLSQGVKEEQLFSREKFIKAFNEYLDEGHSERRAYEKALNDERVGINYMVFEGDIETFILTFSSNVEPKYKKRAQFYFMPKQGFRNDCLRAAYENENRKDIYKVKFKHKGKIDENIEDYIRFADQLSNRTLDLIRKNEIF